MIELDANDLAASLNDAKSQMKPTKEELLHIMEPFLSDRLEQKRSVELADIAKLVLIRGANLESMMESPDFVIAEAGEKIGVEIRQLVTKKIKYNRYIQKLFDRASGMYKEQFGNDKLLVSFWLAPGFNYTRPEKEPLAGEIVTFIRRQYLKREFSTPGFIERYTIMPHSDVSFYFNEGAYCSEGIGSEIILDAVAEKEKKIAAYIEHSGTPIQWLLLVNRGVGSDSFDLEDFEGIGTVETKFEHIFLLQDFDMDLIKLH